ncbi:hypothetical protein BCR44DRAFT_64499 [Catenaria anguillulae PL171]|uniref:Uncharacterized protein n=1 Tax=Catenaria anguillulae PL171 TaxID=765915 RepID=A0A1Y2HYQ2_9FUNG|nr:hypothetical protein BCR44DRAFT_64499 [Catenaria anguillulae PL171]
MSSQFQPSQPLSPRSTRPSSPVDSSFAGNATSSPVTPLTPSLLFASLACPLASSEPVLSPISARTQSPMDSSTSPNTQTANPPITSIRVIPPSPATAHSTIAAPQPIISRNAVSPSAVAGATYGQSYPPRPSSANRHDRAGTLAQRVLNPPPVQSTLFESNSALLGTAPSSSLPKLEDPLIPLPAFTSEAHPPRPRRSATEDPTQPQPGVHPVAEYLYNSSLLASSLIHSTVPHNLGLVRRASSTGHLPLLLVPSRFTSIPTTPISKEAWLASQGRLPLPSSDSEANGHSSDTGSIRTPHSHHSRRSSRVTHLPKSSTLAGSRRGSVASTKSLAPSSRLRHKRPRRPISPGVSSAGPYSAEDDAAQAADSDSSSAEDRDQCGVGASRGYATFAPTWLVDDEALGVSDRSSPDNGVGSSKDLSTGGPSPMVLGPAVATKVANRVCFNGAFVEYDVEADSFDVESEGEFAPLLGGRQRHPLRSRRPGPPPPHRLLLLVFLLAGAAVVIVLFVFLVYASTHPLASFKIRVGSTQFLWTTPAASSSSSSSATVGAAMRRRRSPKPSVVLDGFQLSLNVSGFNKNFMSDIVLRQDQLLSVVLVEWRGPLLSSTTTNTSSPSPESANQPPFNCDSIPAMSRSSLGNLSLHKHKHQFTFPPGASSRWTVAANIRHPRSEDEDLDDKDPVWHRYRTSAQPAYSYYLAIHGEYAYTQAWVVEREIPVCLIHQLPPAPSKAM